MKAHHVSACGDGLLMQAGDDAVREKNSSDLKNVKAQNQHERPHLKTGNRDEVDGA